MHSPVRVAAAPAGEEDQLAAFRRFWSANGAEEFAGEFQEKLVE
jgi:hypothetical protein